MLRQLQSRLGCGSLKLRSGSKSYRYRLHRRPELLWLLPQLNGYIRHSRRLSQYHRVARLLGFRVLENQLLEPYDPWYAGFFDADGSVVLRESPGYFPQLSLRVGQKHRPDLEPFRALGGGIYYDAGSGGSFVWSASAREEVETFWQRLRPHLRSARSRRLFLLPRYRELLALKAHLPGSDYREEWQAFRRR